MRLKLKDNPREWQKFAGVAVLFATGVLVLLWRRSWVPDLVLQIALAALALLLVVSLIRPTAFRPAYLVSMRFSHAVGQMVGRVLLVFCFLFILTPIAILLRLLGHDLLHLRRRPCDSYWKTARPPAPHDRAF